MKTGCDDIQIKNHKVTRNYEEGTITALEGRFTFTVEMAKDLQDYYDITPDGLISFVDEASTKLPGTDPLDIRVETLPAFRPETESIFKISVVQRAQDLTLKTGHFSSFPIRKAKPVI